MQILTPEEWNERFVILGPINETAQENAMNETNDAMAILGQIDALPDVKHGYFVWQAPNEELEGGFRLEELVALAAHVRELEEKVKRYENALTPHEALTEGKESE